MEAFSILIILCVCFVILLIVWFAISSCLGDEIRAHLSGRSRRRIPTTFGLQYAQIMGQSGSTAGWEQIEMQDMLDSDESHRK
jgi:hypothetical protein